MALTPVPFRAWIDSIRPSLEPPVCNKLLYAGQLKVMVVTGPNERKDFHVEEGEEIFYQLEGDMRLDVMEGGRLKQIVIREGEVFTLPSRIPHSPQRFANTMGLVIERERLPGEIDGLRWYDDHDQVLYEEWFPCEDLGVQLIPVIKRFLASPAFRSGQPMQTYGEPPLKIDTQTRLPPPRDLKPVLRGEERVEQLMLFDGEFKTRLLLGKDGGADAPFESHTGEVFLYQMRGASAVHVQRADAVETVALRDQDVLLLPPGSTLRVVPEHDARCMVVTSKVF